MLLLAALLAALIILFEYTYSWAVLREPRRPRIAAVHRSSSALRTCIVLPGFCNPPGELGQGVKRFLVRYGPMLVVDYGTKMRFNDIYATIMTAMDKLKGPRKLLIYGHSMGGPLGAQFHERYERDGSPYGPICELIMDCPPSTGKSLAAPAWVKAVLRIILPFYWGGPIGALVLAAGNYISRKTMPAPLSPSVDRELYKRYAHGLMWANNRAAIAQLKYLLRRRMSKVPVVTSTRVICIATDDHSRDKLVRQWISVPDWKREFPNLHVIRDSRVGHAWPMEQPEAYDSIFRRIMRSVVVSNAG